MNVFRSLSEALRSGFHVDDRTPRGYVVRLRSHGAGTRAIVVVGPDRAGRSLVGWCEPDASARLEHQVFQRRSERAGAAPDAPRNIGAAMPMLRAGAFRIRETWLADALDDYEVVGRFQVPSYVALPLTTRKYDAT